MIDLYSKHSSVSLLKHVMLAIALDFFDPLNGQIGF